MPVELAFGDIYQTVLGKISLGKMPAENFSWKIGPPCAYIFNFQMSHIGNVYHT